MLFTHSIVVKYSKIGNQRQDGEIAGLVLPRSVWAGQHDKQYPAEKG